MSSATARPRRSSDSSLAAGRGSASASVVTRVRVAAPMEAMTARRQALRVISFFEDWLLGPRPTSSTRSARNSFEIRDQPGFAGLAGEVAALHEPRELFAATQVESLGFRGQFAVILNTDGDTIDGQLCERLRPRIELHWF